MSSKALIPIVDEWSADNKDTIFTQAKNIIVAPLHEYYHLDNSNSKIDYFMVNPKKSFNSDDLRMHFCHYINYFERFFDNEKEYFTNLATIKFMIDAYPEYNADNLKADIMKYILQPNIFAKTKAMVDHNYSLELSYKSANNPQLQYTNDHARYLMQMSILMNMIIPLITHFAYMRRVSEIDEFILDFFDLVLFAPPFKDVNITAKLYETAISNVTKNEKNNMVIWNMQGIRGKDTVTHAMAAVRNIILNIMPKYKFNSSMVSLNYTSIQKSNAFQVTDISYEFSYIPLSSSKRDGEDNTSDMDKYETNLVKQNEAIYLQSKTNCDFTMNKIDSMWGPFNEDEIDFYYKSLANENKEIINGFQKQLVFNLFYKYFGDTVSINAINARDYIKLMLIARRMLQGNQMTFMPYIVSSKVDKVVSRKTLNKKELTKMQQSQYFQMVQDKYKNDKIYNQILGTIATIITSTFHAIDYNDPELNGKLIDIEPDMIIEEALLYILLI